MRVFQDMQTSKITTLGVGNFRKDFWITMNLGDEIAVDQPRMITA
jgi:hypothetical protein